MIAYLEAIPEIRAQERLARITDAALGAGTLAKQEAERLHGEIRKAAEGRRPKPKPTKRGLALNVAAAKAAGFAVKVVEKKKDAC